MNTGFTRSRQRAFTLIEVVLASAITAILLLAVQSVIILAAHAVPGSQSKLTTLTGAVETLAELDADLAFATNITSRSATAITFQVADRTGNGTPETITWSWDGTLGGTLYRTFNSNPAVAMASNVQAFSLTYDTRMTLGPSSPSTSAETLLASNTLVTGVGAPPTNSLSIDKQHFWGEYISPALPSNAASWSITRVQLMMSGNGGAGSPTLQLQQTNSTNIPNGTILDQAPINFASIPATFSYTQFTFTKATNLPPASGIAILINNAAGSNAAGAVESQNTSPGVVANILNTVNTGSSWTQTPTNANLLYYVYGTITSPGTPPTLYSLTGVRGTSLFR